jgi:hypothetical protein
MTFCSTNGPLVNAVYLSAVRKGREASFGIVIEEKREQRQFPE